MEGGRGGGEAERVRSGDTTIHGLAIQICATVKGRVFKRRKLISGELNSLLILNFSQG